MFTEAQKAKIRQYLGFPLYGTWETTLESAMSLIGGVAEHQTEVESVLTAIAAIETEISGLHEHAVFEKAEETTLNKNRYRDLRVAGRREVKRLASMLNVEVRKDVFATGWSGGPLGMG